MLFSLLFVLFAHGCHGNEVSVNPIRKITAMLEDMQKELTREKELEGETFEKAMCACQTGEADLKKTIEDATASSAHLTSELEEESASKARLDQDLKEHYSSKSQAQADLDKASTIRAKESDSFSKHAQMAKFSINALSKAIPQLEGGVSASSFMQQEDSPDLRRVIEITRFLTSGQREQVLSFLDDGLADNSGAPSAPVAEIVGVLKSLQDDMTKDFDSASTSEKAAASGYGELKAAKMSEISAASEAIITKEKQAGKLALSIATNKDALDDSQTELADAEKYLKDLTDSCGRKAGERDARAKMRTDELAAISQAISILTSDDALDVFKKAVPSAALITKTRKTFDAAFLQANVRHPGMLKAQKMVQRLAKKHSSKKYDVLLMALNNEIHSESLEEPEEGVKYAGAAEKVVTDMVDHMVHTLHDEDVEDEHKKEFCANETTKTAELKQEKEDLSATLTANMEEFKDAIATLVAEIKSLNGDVNTNDKEVFDATELRQKEHQEFIDSFSTMDTAKRLIDKAANRLHDFYHPKMMGKKRADVTSSALNKAGLSLAVQRMQASFGENALLQTKAHHSRVAPPVIPDTPTTYEKKESGGVLGLMNEMKEELVADMRQLETEEKNSAADYVRIMGEAKETRAQLVKTINHKEEEKADLEEKLGQAKTNKKLTEKEIHNIALYMVQLHAECDFLMRNFEARHDGRVDEETGLEDAKTIVTHEEPPTHSQIEADYKSEKSDADVEQHFPEEGGHIHAAPAEAGAF